MLDALLEKDMDDPDVLECYFLEALYCSLGGSLLEAGKVKFDEYIKKLAGMSTVHDEKTLAGPGELPGKMITVSVEFHCTIGANHSLAGVGHIVNTIVLPPG